MDLLRAECLTCMAERYPKRYPADAPQDKILTYVKKTLEILAGAKKTMAGPVLVRDINDIHEELFGDRLVYTEVKHFFNSLVLKQEDLMWKRILTAADPLLMAVQFAACGNLIDFGILSDLDDKAVLQAIDQAGELVIEEDELLLFKEKLEAAKSLVYLTDNCGEIVMDKLLIRLIKELYPGLSLTVIVRGAEVLNDATLDDAAFTGLDQVVPVITNGNNVAGTWLPELSEEAMEAISGADLIISKGQANLETLRACSLPIFFLFLCKCEMLAREYQVPRFSARLIHNRNCDRL